MIINWIKKNFTDYPKFYQNYLENFNSKLVFNQFIVFDLEVHTSNEKLIKIFAYKVNNQEIILKNTIDLMIDHEININENNKISETNAIIQFLEFIKNIPLISYQINDKIELINQILKKNEAGKIENEIFDLEILFKNHQKNDDEENISLEKICEILKLKDCHLNNLYDKVYYESLIFIKLNKKLKLELLK